MERIKFPGLYKQKMSLINDLFQYDSVPVFQTNIVDIVVIDEKNNAV